VTKLPGKIITFYSYKGGTGRSMTLANIAHILATHPSYGGKKVLMIDWDLEAPGLYRYFEKHFATTARSAQSRTAALDQAGGLTEILDAAAGIYQDRAPKGELPESQAYTQQAAEIFDQIRRLPEFDKSFLQVGEMKNLVLLKAGREDDEYPNRVREFRWESFYSNYGSFFTHFRLHLMKEYDFVLIDSRTGLTDTSGICTRVMPEKLVGVFAPNQQNIEGLTTVIRRCAEYRRSSRDERSLVYFPLASRIDSQADKLRLIWWKGGKLGEKKLPGYQKVFEDLFIELFDLDECDLDEYFDSTQIPHSSDYAYGEEIAASLVGTSDKLSIGTACVNLTKRLLQPQPPWEPLEEHQELSAAQRQVQEATLKAEELERNQRRARKITIAVLIFALIAVSLSVAVVLRQRTLRQQAEEARRLEEIERNERILAEGYNITGTQDLRDKKYDDALSSFTSAIQHKSDYVEAYLNRARTYSYKGDLDRAIADYTQALQIKPDAVPFFERGSLYTRKGKEDLALADYNYAIKFKPDYWNAYLSRGYIYGNQRSYDLALSDFTKIIESSSDQFKAKAYLARGLTYSNLRDRERSISDYLKAIELSADPLIRSPAAEGLRSLGYQAQTQPPTKLKVFLLYGDGRDGPSIDAISASLRQNGFEVQTEQIDTGFANAEVAYNYGSQDVKTAAEKIKGIVLRTLKDKSSVILSVNVFFRNTSTYVPSGYIDVWIPPLANFRTPAATAAH
jgi:tetratricopeptide (TPR) repeat protein